MVSAALSVKPFADMLVTVILLPAVSNTSSFVPVVPVSLRLTFPPPGLFADKSPEASIHLVSVPLMIKLVH